MLLSYIVQLKMHLFGTLKNFLNYGKQFTPEFKTSLLLLHMKLEQQMFWKEGKNKIHTY